MRSEPPATVRCLCLRYAENSTFYRMVFYQVEELYHGYKKGIATGGGVFRQCDETVYLDEWMRLQQESLSVC